MTIGLATVRPFKVVAQWRLLLKNPQSKLRCVNRRVTERRIIGKISSQPIHAAHEWPSGIRVAR
jgi:hypothetical protein